MIRIDALWLSVEPLDMRAGTETILARVVRNRFGAQTGRRHYMLAKSAWDEQCKIEAQCWPELF